MAAEFDILTFLLAIILVVFLVLLNGFFVASEFALVSARPSKVEELIQKTGNRRAKAVKRAIDNQDEVISATQLGITMSSLALGFLAGSFIEPIIENLFDGLGILALFGGIAVGGLFAYGITTYAHVVLGELAPKSVALQYPVKTSLWIAAPLNLFTTIFKPIIWLFNKTGWLVLAIFGIKPIIGHRNVHSEDELKLLISQSSQAGILDEQESEILKRTFDLPDTLIRMIMTPKRDMATLSITDNFIDIVKTVSSTGHSRFPVFDVDHKHIIGFLYAKDLLEYLSHGLEQDRSTDIDFENVDVSELLRDAEYVPETMRAATLLEILQEKKRHSAIVVDEFGELAGLITLEDILELLVGDIQDEYDIEPVEIVPSENGDEGELTVAGQTSLDDFNEYFKIEIHSEISVTIGGLIIEKLGRIPIENEQLKLENLIFTVEEVSRSRIVSLLVREIEEGKLTGKEAKNANDLTIVDRSED